MKRLFCLIALSLYTSLPSHAQEGFHLKPNDRVVFFGDSITDQRLYTTFVETYAVTRYPKMNLSFVHSGWGGDRVNGGVGGPIDVRLWRDVLPYDPTVVTIMLGMNDGRYRAFDQAIFDEFGNGMQAIVRSLKRQLPNVRLTLIQPSPYDDVTRTPLFEGGYNQVLRRYSDFLKDLAAKEGLTTADMNTPVVAGLAKANTLDAANAAKLIPDRVHPGPAGHLMMAQALLLDWNATPLVTEVEIDATRKSITAQKNTYVQSLRAENNTWTWTQLDASLPMPVDTKDALTSLAIKAVNFFQSLNQQPLRIKGLPAGNYTLRIDGSKVATYSAADWAQGRNLAELPTPMLEQAAAVHALTLQHASIHNTRWRQVQVPLQRYQSPELLEALKGLDELEAALVKQQRQTALPLLRSYELVRE